MPVSEVEEIVLKNIEQDKRNNEAFSHIKRSYRWYIFWKYVIIVCPFLFLGALIIHFYLQVHRTSPVKPPEFITTSSQTFTGFRIDDVLYGSSQLFSVTKKSSREPVRFDAYVFEEYLSDVVDVKRRTTFVNASLPTKTVFNTETFNVHESMSLTTKFCFRSQNSGQNASLRLYKLTNLDKIAQFHQLNSSNSGNISRLNLTYDEFMSISNKTFCGSSKVKGRRKLVDKEAISSAFAFDNSGNSTVLLKLRITVAEISYRRNLATHFCSNVKKCKIPFSSTFGRYIIISMNFTTSGNEIVINRSYGDSSIFSYYDFIALSLCAYVILVILLFFISVAERYSCIQRFRKWYFQREKIQKRFGVWERWALIGSRNFEQLKSIIIKRLERRENLIFNTYT